MKDYRYIILRVFPIFFLLSASISLSGCSYISNAVSATFSTAYNVVMWPPRQAWKYTGGKVFDVKNEQQTDLGPRRKPTGNPAGRSAVSEYSATGTIGGYPSMPQISAPPMPNTGIPQDFPQGVSDAMPPYPSVPGDNSGFPRTGYNSAPPMPQATPPMGQMPSMDQNSNIGQPPSSYPSVNPYGGDLGDGAPSTIPQMPSMQGGMPSPYSAQNPGMASSGMPSVPGGVPSPPPYSSMQGGGIPAPNNMDSMEADAAYSGGGGSSERKWWSWIPFTSSKHKMDIKYEQMSADIAVSAKDFYEGNYPESDPISIEPLEHSPKEHYGNPGNRKKASRAASMFPLEQYAPKPTVFAKKINAPGSDYPKLADTPSGTKTPEDVESAEKRLEKIINESEEIQEKQGEIHNTRPTPNPVKKDGDSSQNINDAGSYKLTNRTSDKPHAPRYETLGSETLKSDAEILSSLEKSNGYTPNLSAEPQKKPGFFSRLFGRSNDKSSSKMITRKSEPPRPAEIAKPIPNPEIALQSHEDIVKKYQPSSGSLLPKSRYTDRRKVPQTDE